MLIQSLEPLATRVDFLKISYIPERFDKNILRDVVLDTQNRLLYIELSKELYNDIIENFNNRFEILSFTSDNNDTIIELSLDDVTFLNNFDYIALDGFKESNIFNKKNGVFFNFTIQDSTHIKLLNFNSSTGDFTNETAAYLYGALVSKYYTLRKAFLPFLTQLSFADYLRQLDKKNTLSGNVTKNTKESINLLNSNKTKVTESLAALINKVYSRAEFWRKQLHLFLEENIAIYDLYTRDKTKEQNFNIEHMPVSDLPNKFSL